jgi:hypothetical protein
MNSATPDYLIRILNDKSIDLGVRDDAAMDLGTYDEPEVLDALIQVAVDVNEDELILWSCGESIKDIWLRKGSYSSQMINAELLKKLAPAARQECNINLPETD